MLYNFCEVADHMQCLILNSCKINLAVVKVRLAAYQTTKKVTLDGKLA